MPRVAICADTHVPSRAAGIPDRFERVLREADHVVHAGDFDSPSAYDRVETVADGSLTAVRGNVDPAGLDLPRSVTVELEGVAFVVTHGTGRPAGYRDRVLETVRETAPDAERVVGVAGHTHDVLDETVGGIRLLNPGSATGAAPADRITMLIADVASGDLDVELLEE